MRFVTVFVSRFLFFAFSHRKGTFFHAGQCYELYLIEEKIHREGIK